MNKAKKITAMLCATMLVFCTVLTGCAKKVSYKDNKSSTDGKIKIGEGTDGIPEDAEIVVGEDGKSYIVDGEGNSMVYDATSAYVVNNNVPTSSTTSTTNTTTKKTTTTTTTTTKKTEPTTSQQDHIISVLGPVRKTYTPGKSIDISLSNCSLDTPLIIKFNDGEGVCYYVFNKGMYGNKTVGCETGFYKGFPSSEVFNGITAVENVKNAAKLYSGSSVIASMKSELNLISGWRYAFEDTSKTYNPQSLVMVNTIKFKNADIANAFADALEVNGYTEKGEIQSDPNEKVQGYEFIDESTVVFAWK